jgi:hypothetical protein
MPGVYSLEASENDDMVNSGKDYTTEARRSAEITEE